MTISTLLAALLLMAVASITTNASATCTDELVAFSPCLPYVSSPPNNLSTEPSSQCCELYSSSFISGNASCLCYLLRVPSILGFPLNNTRITSLSSQCDRHNNLQLLCQETPMLPPLPAPPGLNYAPSPSPTAPAESAKPSSTPTMSAAGTSTSGNTTNSTAVNASQTSGSLVFPPLLVYLLWPLFIYGLI